MGINVEYLGFATVNGAREYSLQTQEGGVFHKFVRAIPLAAFESHRARYQDAPEICFQKLMRELAACAGVMPSGWASVTDSDLEDYRTSHSAKPPRTRAKPAPVVPQT